MVKTIMLKLHEDEHALVKKACMMDGRRSMSSLARSALLNKANDILKLKYETLPNKSE